jgi:nitrogen fixation protein FixH
VSSSPQSKAPLRDRIIPWYFVMAFMVIFAVNGLFAYLATSTLPAVVTEEAYEKGLAYNETLAQREAQRDRGWQSELLAEGGMLRAQLRDKQGLPLEDAQVTLTITRPVGAAESIVLQLAPGAPGHYKSAFEFPATGQWDVTMDALWNQQPYQQTTRVVIK